MLSPDGYCMCGCGAPTQPCHQTDRRLGNVKGCPQAYIDGHQFHRKPANRDELIKLFWSKVVKSDGCWEWSGCLTSGYGFINHGPRTDRKVIRAHRFSWEIHHGEIPAGLMVCHTCDNRKCVRPDHLFLGTAKDNVQDALKKGRMVIPGVTRTIWVNGRLELRNGSSLV